MMGAFNTFLNLASLGADISMANKLEEMRRHGEAATAINAMINEIRSKIFSYNEMAKTILGAELSPREAAGAMLTLEMRLNNSGLTPGLFPELNDKEYVSNTIRFIKAKASSLMAELPVDEQQEVRSIVSQALALPDYIYYTENYSKLTDYKKALPISAGNSGCIRFVGAILLMIGINFLIPLFFASGMNVNYAPGLNPIFLLVGSVATVGGIWMLFNAKKKAATKKVIERVKEQVDIERLLELDKRFHSDFGHIAKLRIEARSALDQFFSDSKLLED